MRETGKYVNIGGVPIFIPNDIGVETPDFYVSYNTRDIAIYGDVTTALVLNNPLKFLILNGNHLGNYNTIVQEGGGYEECLDYFKANIHLKSNLSDNWDEIAMFDEEGNWVVIKDPERS